MVDGTRRLGVLARLTHQCDFSHALVTETTSRMRFLRPRRTFTSSSSSSIAALVAAAKPSSLAVLAPQQGVKWSYEELDLKARCLAAGLEDLGYGPGSIAISDVPNVAENLLVQTALAHLGAGIATPPKDADALAAMCAKHDVRGVICVNGAEPPLSSPLASPLPAVHLEVAEGARPAAGSVALGELVEHCPPRGSAPAATGSTTLGVFGGAALTQSSALSLGAAAAAKLAITDSDRVCCSVTLMHAFGLTAVTAALGTDACVVCCPPSAASAAAATPPSGRPLRRRCSLRVARLSSSEIRTRCAP